MRMLNDHDRLIKSPIIPPASSESGFDVCFTDDDLVLDVDVPDVDVDTDPKVVAVPVLVTGVAIGVVGLYVTPFIEAATWKIEPPPYS